MTEAWLMCDAIEDQRLENRRTPNVPVSYEDLADIGVWVRKMSNVDTMLEPGPQGEPCEVDRIMAQQGYKNRDEVVCSPDKLPNYDDKLKMFFQEHIHEDEEIRLIRAGSGYFDVRNAKDEWVRIRVTAGDLLVVPAGIYHRFTMDEGNFTHAIRLFYDAPKWTPVNRPCEENPFRQEYLRKYVTAPPPKCTILGAANDTDNIYFNHPEKFDDVVRGLVHGTLDAGKKDLLIMLFSGVVNEKTGKSWCPDCVEVVEPLRAAVAAAQAKGRKVYFVQVGVERSSYLKNPNYLLRKHPFVELKSIPTVIVCEAKPEVEGEDDEAAGLRELARMENFNDEWLAKL